MPEQLATVGIQHVPEALFLDTEVFDSLGFNYESPALLQLAKLVQAGKISVLLTTVTSAEVERHVSQWVQRSKTALTKLPREAAILRHLSGNPFSSVFDKGMWARAEKELLGQFRTFCTELNVEVLALDEVNPSEILDDYFAERPPFESGKKKSEFPDAFAVRALLNWSRARKRRVHVVTRDAGWHRFCTDHPELIHYSSLDKFIELFADHLLVEPLKDALRSNLGPITQTIEERLPDAYFFVEDAEGEVDEVIVEDVVVQDIHITAAEEGTAHGTLVCSVDFSAHASYEVPGTGSYDSETGQILFAEEECGTVHETIVLRVDASLDYDPASATLIKIRDITVDVPQAISIDYQDIQPPDM